MLKKIYRKRKNLKLSTSDEILGEKSKSLINIKSSNLLSQLINRLKQDFQEPENFVPRISNLPNWKPIFFTNRFNDTEQQLLVKNIQRFGPDEPTINSIGLKYNLSTTNAQIENEKQEKKSQFEKIFKNKFWLDFFNSRKPIKTQSLDNISHSEKSTTINCNCIQCTRNTLKSFSETKIHLTNSFHEIQRNSRKIRRQRRQRRNKQMRINENFLIKNAKTENSLENLIEGKLKKNNDNTSSSDEGGKNCESEKNWKFYERKNPQDLENNDEKNRGTRKNSSNFKMSENFRNCKTFKNENSKNINYFKSGENSPKTTTLNNSKKSENFKNRENIRNSVKFENNENFKMTKNRENLTANLKSCKSFQNFKTSTNFESKKSENCNKSENLRKSPTNRENSKHSEFSEKEKSPNNLRNRENPKIVENSKYLKKSKIPKKTKIAESIIFCEDTLSEKLKRTSSLDEILTENQIFDDGEFFCETELRKLNNFQSESLVNYLKTDTAELEILKSIKTRIDEDFAKNQQIGGNFKITSKLPQRILRNDEKIEKERQKIIDNCPEKNILSKNNKITNYLNKKHDLSPETFRVKKSPKKSLIPKAVIKTTTTKGEENFLTTINLVGENSNNNDSEWRNLELNETKNSSTRNLIESVDSGIHTDFSLNEQRTEKNSFRSTDNESLLMERGKNYNLFDSRIGFRYFDVDDEIFWNDDEAVTRKLEEVVGKLREELYQFEKRIRERISDNGNLSAEENSDFFSRTFTKVLKYFGFIITFLIILLTLKKKLFLQININF